MKGTHKHTEALLIHFDNHRCVSQSEECKYMWTNGKDGGHVQLNIYLII